MAGDGGFDRAASGTYTERKYRAGRGQKRAVGRWSPTWLLDEAGEVGLTGGS